MAECPKWQSVWALLVYKKFVRSAKNNSLFISTLGVRLIWIGVVSGAASGTSFFKLRVMIESGEGLGAAELNTLSYVSGTSHDLKIFKMTLAHLLTKFESENGIKRSKIITV